MDCRPTHSPEDTVLESPKTAAPSKGSASRIRILDAQVRRRTLPFMAPLLVIGGRRQPKLPYPQSERVQSRCEPGLSSPASTHGARPRRERRARLWRHHWWKTDFWIEQLVVVALVTNRSMAEIYISCRLRRSWLQHQWWDQHMNSSSFVQREVLSLGRVILSSRSSFLAFFL